MLRSCEASCAGGNRSDAISVTSLGGAAGRALLVVVTLALAACSAPDSVGQPPRLEIARTVHDAGRVRQGDRIEHRFVLRNTGGRDLRIRRVRASCDCTAGEVAVPIAPGGIGEIPVSLDTAGRFGRVTRSIAVFSNDPAAPAVLLKLVADVEFDVAADPPRLYVGRVRPGDEVRVLGRIALSGRTQVTRIESAGPVVTALLGPARATESWSERRLKVQIREHAPAGPFTDSVRLHTTSTQTPVLDVPIVGVVEEET